MNATNILAQKYFRGTIGTAERENSLRQVIDRVADTIADWGSRDGYFADDVETETFRAELKHLIVEQKAAFNSPVWFNIGVPGVPKQGSACFILAVDDSMGSILNWYVEEGTIFKGGSGSGVNLSRIRSSKELLAGGGTASGPVSFMRGADASAGTIKSGGKTRRAAKMVILDVDHPDIREFIWCKAREEHKARALEAAGFDMDLDGKDSYSIQYQNANNSVRVTDEFMQAVLEDKPWGLIGRTTGKAIDTVSAREVFHEIAEAAWECADPGMQFDTTINRWHTAPNTGRISGSNPCSEYMHLDNSACNLASINLLEFLDEDGTFDVDGFRQAVEVVFTAQEILVGNADYPTEKIAETTRRFRELGLGYANLGAMLMALGLPYDSDGARAVTASVTALMTGHAYATSARMAARMGPFAGFHENADPMRNVLRMHRDEVDKIDSDMVPASLLGAARQAWEDAVGLGDTYGVRNSQATVLAPTGTISFLMDCDTTGIEPDLGLVKTKKLVGGGTMSIVNQTVPRALRNLGYADSEIVEIVAYIDEHKSILGAPHVKAEHLPVFACSMGDNVIHYRGHVTMMAAAQPFISGAISKTVNMPADVSIDEVEQLHLDAWRMGLKAVAIYRDNTKVAQPLSTTKKASCRRRWRLRTSRRAPRADRRARGRAGRPRDCSAGHDEDAPATQAAFVDLRLPCRRLRRLCHRRRVRGWNAGRGVPQGLQAGLDTVWGDGCLRHRREPRAPARRAARHLCPQVHQHALRAGGDDRRPGSADRLEPRRLHLPAPGARLPDPRRAGRARDPLDGGADPTDAARPRRRRARRRCQARARTIWRGRGLDGEDDSGRPKCPSPVTHRSATPAAISCSEPGSCYACSSCGATSGCS